MTDEPKIDEQQVPPTQEPTLGQVISDFVNHHVKATQEVGRALEALIPPDFRAHSAEAVHEIMLAYKAVGDGISYVLDTELDKVRQSGTSSGDSGSGPSTTGKSKVKVEVN
ncbi:MAG TPA: hypothetical protein VMT34_10635 [Aggregatilineales bacterium]|nr:hypothetical protein [Aggregatilineales bacterium]